MNDEQLTTRLQAAAEHIEISESAQARHLQEIASALSEGDVIALPSGGWSHRRRIVASIVAAAVIAPAGLAAASEGSVPGDALYGVKRISEQVLVFIDSDVIARHRIEEIEILESTGEATPELLDRARGALEKLGEDHPLWQRLEASARSADASDQSDFVGIGDDRSDEEAPDRARAIDVPLPDGSAAVVTIEDGRISQVALPQGWSVGEIDDDDATIRSARFEVEIALLDNGLVGSKVITEFADSVGDDSESEAVDTPDSDDDDASADSPAAPADPDAGNDPDEDGDDDDSSDIYDDD